MRHVLGEDGGQRTRVRPAPRLAAAAAKLLREESGRGFQPAGERWRRGGRVGARDARDARRLRGRPVAGGEARSPRGWQAAGGIGARDARSIGARTLAGYEKERGSTLAASRARRCSRRCRARWWSSPAGPASARRRSCADLSILREQGRRASCSRRRPGARRSGSRRRRARRRRRSTGARVAPRRGRASRATPPPARGGRADRRRGLDAGRAPGADLVAALPRHAAGARRRRRSAALGRARAPCSRDVIAAARCRWCA